MRSSACLALLLAAVFAVGAMLADFEKWGEDEAGNLWQATDLRAGQVHRLGLVSSVGIRNMLGAALLAVPLAGLPDLLAISRALCGLHLLVLVPLAWWLGRSPRERGVAFALCALSPSFLLSAFSLWNQYLSGIIGVAVLATLLFLLEARSTAYRRACAVIVCVALSGFEPTVHLMHLPDALLHLGLLVLVLRVNPLPVDRTVVASGLLALTIPAYLLYAPWIADTLQRLDHAFPSPLGTVQWVGVALALATAGVIAGRRLAGSLPRLLAWLDRVCGAPVLFWTLVALIPLALLGNVPGVQIAQRLAEASPLLFVALPALQGLLCAVLLPAPSRLWAEMKHAEGGRDYLQRLYGARSRAAALLFATLALTALGRLLLGAAPWTRSDLWVNSTPLLLAPLILLAQGQGRLARRAPSLAIGVAWCLFVGVALAMPDAAYRQHNPLSVPPSEMRRVVDWMAARHRATGGGAQIDLSYDLARDKEWIPTMVTWHPDFRWYSIGRPYDWLLRRRYGLRNAHEGQAERTRGGRFQFGYVGDVSPGWQVIARFAHLEIRRRR